MLFNPPPQYLTVHGARLLSHDIPSREHDEIRDTLHVVTACQSRLSFGIDLQDHDLARELLRRTLHLRGNHATGAAPRCPKIHEHGNGCVSGDVIEFVGADRQWLAEGRQIALATATMAPVRQVPGGNAVLDSTVGTRADHRMNVRTRQALVNG